MSVTTLYAFHLIEAGKESGAVNAMDVDTSSSDEQCAVVDARSSSQSAVGAYT